MTSGVLTDAAMPTTVSGDRRRRAVPDCPGRAAPRKAPRPRVRPSCHSAGHTGTRARPARCRTVLLCPGRSRSRRARATSGPRCIATLSIEASGAGRPEMTRFAVQKIAFPSIWARATGHGPALAVTPAAVAVRASAASLVAPSYSITRCAPFAVAKAVSNGSFVSTRMLSASVAAPAARKRTDREDGGLQSAAPEVSEGLGGDRAHQATIRVARSPLMLPSTRWTIRCARARASCSSWVTRTMV